MIGETTDRLRTVHTFFILGSVISETHALIKTVTQETAAKTILKESLIEGHPATAETMARLEATGSKHNAIWKTVLLWILALTVLAACAYPSVTAILQIHEATGLPPYDAIGRHPLPSGLTAQQRLLFTDPEKDRVEQCHQLHLSDPQNPAFFAEYVQQSLTKTDSLPPEALDTAARVAPNNALFLYLAAAHAGRNAVEKQPNPGANRKKRMVDGVSLPPPLGETSYRIEDRKAYEEALAWIAKAAALPELESYTNTMMATKCRLLPARNLVEFTVSLLHAYGSSSPLLSLMKISYVFNARAEELSKSGDREAFRHLAAQRDAFIHGLTRNPDIQLVGELVNQAIASNTAVQFHAAAERLGLADLEARYRQQMDAFQTEKDRREIQRKQQASDDLGRYSTLAGIGLPAVRSHVASPPPLDDPDLAPLRCAEHEWVTGIGLLQVALILLVLAGAGAITCQLAPRRLRLPAKHLAKTLDTTDRCWIIIPGIALPICFFLLIRLTPLSGTSHGFMHFLFTFPGVHLTALCLGLLMLPALLTRWRLARQLAPFGFNPPRRFLTTIVPVCLLIPSLTAYPMLVHVDFSAASLCAIAAPFALALILVLANLAHRLVTKPTERIFSCSTAIAVLPAYAISIIALCSLLPIHRTAEKQWMTKETLFRIDPIMTYLGTYEGKIASQKRRELQAITELK